MVSKLRAQRIGERIREELSEMLINVITDPRLHGVNITDVSVDRELAYATVFVSSHEGPGNKEQVLEGLQHAQGFLRSQLAQRIELRAFPRLRFKWDSTPDRAARIDELIASLHEEPFAEEDAENDSHDG
jgi:ribosome-binding factor A